MAQQTFNDGEQLSSVRSKLNANATDAESRLAALEATGGFGANYETQATAATLADTKYGSSADKTIKWTGTSGGLTHCDSTSLSAGDYVFILNATADPLVIDFANASDTFIATDYEDDIVDPGQVKRYEYLGSNEWRIG